MIKTRIYSFVLTKDDDGTPMASFTDYFDACDFLIQFLHHNYSDIAYRAMMDDINEQTQDINIDIKSGLIFRIENVIRCDKIPLELSVKIC